MLSNDVLLKLSVLCGVRLVECSPKNRNSASTGFNRCSMSNGIDPLR